MFDFEVVIDDKSLLTARIETVESREIIVGVRNKSQKAAIAEPVSAGFGVLPNDSSRTKVRKVKELDNNYTLGELLLDLEGYGLFTDAVRDPHNEDLITMFEALKNIFLKNDWDSDDENILTNASRALIRNRIIENRLGRNSKVTADNKGFNRPMMDTGTLFTNIESWYETK